MQGGRTADDDAMGIALDNVRAHRNEVIDKVHTALKEFLEEQDTALGLRGEDDRHAHQVRRKRRPDTVFDLGAQLAQVTGHA